MFWLSKKILIADFKGLLNVKYKKIVKTSYINSSTSKAHETNFQWTFGNWDKCSGKNQ